MVGSSGGTDVSTKGPCRPKFVLWLHPVRAAYGNHDPSLRSACNAARFPSYLNLSFSLVITMKASVSGRCQSQQVRPYLLLANSEL